MSGYDLLKIVLNWAGAPLTAEDIKKAPLRKAISQFHHGQL